MRKKEMEKEERGNEEMRNGEMEAHELVKEGKGGRQDMMGKEAVDTVFVYGTLMEGFGNHARILDGEADLVGRGEVSGSLYHLREGYPALLEGGDRIVGEAFGPVDKALLRRLDGLEGYEEGGRDSLYERRVVDVTMTDGSTRACWIYRFNDRSYAMRTGVYLAHGDWRRYTGEAGKGDLR